MWWPRKPEPPKELRFVGFVSFCHDCDCELITLVPMICAICAERQAARKFVDSLPYSVQDRYLAGIEQDLEA